MKLKRFGQLTTFFFSLSLSLVAIVGCCFRCRNTHALFDYFTREFSHLFLLCGWVGVCVRQNVSTTIASPKVITNGSRSFICVFVISISWSICNVSFFANCLYRCNVCICERPLESYICLGLTLLKLILFDFKCHFRSQNIRWWLYPMLVSYNEFAKVLKIGLP